MADMADPELAPTEFELKPTIQFNATDIVSSLHPAEVMNLIEELDSELNSWEATILLARYFDRAAKQAPAELLALDDDDLADAIESGESDAEDK